MICNSTRKADAAVECKLTQMLEGQQSHAVRNNEPQSQDTELWMKFIQEDPPVVKKGLARGVFSPTSMERSGYTAILGCFCTRLSKRGLRIPAGGVPPRVPRMANNAVEDVIAVMGH